MYKDFHGSNTSRENFLNGSLVNLKSGIIQNLTTNEFDQREHTSDGIVVII